MSGEKLTRAWLRWRLGRAERKWEAVDLELHSALFISPGRWNKLCWLRDVILPERIGYLRSCLHASLPAPDREGRGDGTE